MFLDEPFFVFDSDLQDVFFFLAPAVANREVPG